MLKSDEVSMRSLDGEKAGRSLSQELKIDELQEEYFTSYEDVEIHRLMITDEPRTKAYADAIDMNKHLFRGKVVMDVGAGTGILSLFIAAAGAKRVYAVEASGMASVIKKISSDNGFENIIKVLHGRVEDISLPENEKVDVIVSEWMGFYLLHESMLNSVINARDRFLTDEGSIFPSEARLYACPCTLQTIFNEQINFWDSVYNFNMSAMRKLALKSKMVKPEVCLVPKSDLLAEPTCVKTFNLRWVTEKEVKSFSETTFVAITRAGLYQGLCLWFECDFDGREYDEEGKEFGSLVTLSTSPSNPTTHWKQTVVVLGYESDSKKQVDIGSGKDIIDGTSSGVKPCDDVEMHNKGAASSGSGDRTGEGSKSKDMSDNDNIHINSDYEVDEDEVVGWQLTFAQSADNVRHYTITIEMLDPEIEEHPIPCFCPMPRCLIIAKMMEQEEMGEEEDALIHA